MTDELSLRLCIIYRWKQTELHEGFVSHDKNVCFISSSLKITEGLIEDITLFA